MKSFYITLQLQHSNFTLEDKYFDLPFCAVCSYDDGQTSAVKSSVSDFALTQVSVNQGAVIDANAADDNSYPAFSSLLTDSGFNMSGQTNAFCYVECINSASVWTKQIKWGTSSPEPYTADSGGNIVSMNIPLADVGKLNNQVQI